MLKSWDAPVFLMFSEFWTGSEYSELSLRHWLNGQQTQTTRDLEDSVSLVDTLSPSVAPRLPVMNACLWSPGLPQRSSRLETMSALCGTGPSLRPCLLCGCEQSCLSGLRSSGDCGVIYPSISNHHCLHFEMKYPSSFKPIMRRLLVHG